MVEEKLDRVVHHQKIKMMRGARVQDLTLSEDFSVNLVKKPVFIDPEKCSNCGICFEKCPEKGAVLKGFSKNHIPFYAISVFSNLNTTIGQNCIGTEQEQRPYPAGFCQGRFGGHKRT